MSPSLAAIAVPCPPPDKIRNKLERLQERRQLLQQNRVAKAVDLQKVTDYLGIADAVDDALEVLSEELFGKLVKVLEAQLTKALEEVLDQPIELKVTRDYKRGGATMSFHIERDGNPEDIMKGQGGSVANILSVGLRMFALKTLDAAVHDRFLVLDEQDCWLRPDLVPRLVKIVHDAGRTLGFQVLMISHHDIKVFRPYADKIYQFNPTKDGVRVEEWQASPANPDA
ncbi:MAG: DNA repair protein [Planctomycetes bacterium]|nr:DNA repair protein [Planctomycetota bacterium]